jgi:hypothetical protein
MTRSLFPDDEHLGLPTDLYELTMAAGYQPPPPVLSGHS